MLAEEGSGRVAKCVAGAPRQAAGRAAGRPAPLGERLNDLHALRESTCNSAVHVTLVARAAPRGTNILHGSLLKGHLSLSGAAKDLLISRSSEYAIRALTHLASHDDGLHRLARDMAQRLGIPAPFLGKVLQPLVARGLLHSQRGRSGGFKLARKPADIRLVDIVEALETLHPADTCLLGQSECKDDGACPLHAYWQATARSFHERLQGTTLADLVAYKHGHPGCLYPDQDLESLRRALERRGSAPDAVPA